MMICRDYNASEDEFGSISEDEYNKRHRKALKDADSSYKKKKKKKKSVCSTFYKYTFNEEK
jgi:hypothetical protein